MANYIIGLAVFAQILVSHTSRVVGAIIGFLVTTAILLWGMSLYRSGVGITLVVFTLTEPGFFLFCAVWYFYDLRALKRAKTWVRTWEDNQQVSALPYGMMPGIQKQHRGEENYVYTYELPRE